MVFYLGIDFGTSGARCAVINQQAITIAEARYPFEMTLTEDLLCKSWQTALFELIDRIPGQVRQQIKAIAINGTSSTVLLCDRFGKPVNTPLLYNDARGIAEVKELQNIAPPHHTVISATSSLVKLLWMLKLPNASQARYLLHQADWLAFLLHGQLGISDYHNALKLGYDVEYLHYPKWLEQLNLPVELPQVLEPGSAIATVTKDIASSLNLPQDCIVRAGTTDSIAAFIASGAKSPGEAVTSLGSTLAVKLVSRARVEDARYGVYSHRLGNVWLVGGASNTGGAVLRQFFTNEELKSLSHKINTTKPSNLDYYPLIKPGERFPINDANLQPQLTPRPDSDVDFLHGLLESIARIEAQGYHLLQILGADKLSHVYTAGGGAANQIWTAIRSRYLNVAVEASENTEAAYGSAILAMRGIQK